MPKRSIVLFLAFVTVVLRIAAQEPSYKYDTAGVQLEGTPVRRQVYGPPGYGETPGKDERATILVLELLRPITVEPAFRTVAQNNPTADAFKHVREIQLFIPRSTDKGVDKVVGKQVVASGVLNEKVAPSDYTDVWMSVKKISAVR